MEYDDVRERSFHALKAQGTSAPASQHVLVATRAA
jgi:hypothetical protein